VLLKPGGRLRIRTWSPAPNPGQYHGLHIGRGGAADSPGEKQARAGEQTSLAAKTVGHFTAKKRAKGCSEEERTNTPSCNALRKGHVTAHVKEGARNNPDVVPEWPVFQPTLSLPFLGCSFLARLSKPQRSDGCPVGPGSQGQSFIQGPRTGVGALRAVCDDQGSRSRKGRTRYRGIIAL